MCVRSKQSSAVTVPVMATVQTCVSNYKESVVVSSFAVSVCCTLVSLERPAFAVRLPVRCMCVSTHTCVLQKQRVRGHASACDDILSQREQLPVCCTNRLRLWEVGV